MSTEVEICNAALSFLGASPITSLSGTDKRSITCNTWYAITRDNILRSHPWNFAIKRAALVEDVSTPAFGYTHQFVLPVDFLRALKLDYSDIEYKIEGGLLLTDDDAINLVYIAKITDPTKFDSMFNYVFSLQLAYNMAYGLVQSTSLRQSILQELQMQLRDARSASSQEGTPDSFEFNTWIEARL
jgi:hypothetical protein